MTEAPDFLGPSCVMESTSEGVKTLIPQAVPASVLTVAMAAPISVAVGSTKVTRPSASAAVEGAGFSAAMSAWKAAAVVASAGTVDIC